MRLLILFFIISLAQAIPDPYYMNQSWPDHSVKGLQDLLGNGFVQPYIPDVFDCSEMSSYLQWKLQCHGFNAKICQRIGEHSWVAVIIANETYYIEPTSHGNMIVSIFDPGDYDYSKPDRVFQNLSDALVHGVPVEEVDWWTVLSNETFLT